MVSAGTSDDADCLSKFNERKNVVPSCQISTCIENMHGNAVNEDDQECIVNSNIFLNKEEIEQNRKEG